MLHCTDQAQLSQISCLQLHFWHYNFEVSCLILAEYILSILAYFLPLMQAMDGFLIVLDKEANILYVSETITGYVGLTQVIIL